VPGVVRGVLGQEGPQGRLEANDGPRMSTRLFFLRRPTAFFHLILQPRPFLLFVIFLQRAISASEPDTFFS
jgi:hypothetical protein